MADWHELLACPHCREALAPNSGTLRCINGHSFDVAREGYVNLLPGDARTGTADTPGMVDARSAFLTAGHFAPIAEGLKRAVGNAVAGVDGCIVDVGAGTGEYLAAILEAVPDRLGLALDISKHAARRAARAHPRIGAVVCDAWGTLPVGDSVAAAVLSVFAPRNASEFARILRAGGSLIVVAPTERHLAELIGPLGMVRVDPRKDERLEGALSGHFTRTAADIIESALALTRADAVAAARMGPSAHHTTSGEVELQAQSLVEPIAATLSVTITTWEARGE